MRLSFFLLLFAESSYGLGSPCYVQLFASKSGPQKIMKLRVMGSNLRGSFNNLPVSEKINGITKERMRTGREYSCGLSPSGEYACFMYLRFSNPHKGSFKANEADDYGLAKDAADFKSTPVDNFKCEVAISKDGEVKVKISGADMEDLYTNLNSEKDSAKNGARIKSGEDYSCQKNLQSQEISCNLGVSLLTVDGLVNPIPLSSSKEITVPRAKTAP